MTAPGWYHGDGDPDGTVRYWDGNTWIGEAKQSAAGSNAIYYAAAPATQVDLGDVAVRRTLAEQGAAAAATTANPTSTPYGATGARTALKRKRLPEGLKNLAVLVSTFKAIPLAFMALRFVQLLVDRGLDPEAADRYSPPGLDLESDFAVGALILGAILGLGGFLLVTQVRAATRDQASVLFSFALILVVMDLVNLANQWARFGGARVPLAILGITLLQVVVAAWAFSAQSR